jgi:hypothetical protein
VGRGFVLFIAVGLVAAAVTLFVLQLSRSPAPPHSLAKPVSVANAPATGSSGHCVPRTKTLRVTLLISKFDPVAQTVVLDVYMCAVEQTLDALETSTNSNCTSNSPSPSKILFRYEAQLPKGGREREAVVAKSVCSLIEGGGAGPEHGAGCAGGKRCVGEPGFAEIGKFVLPLSGARERYPFDWYAGGATVGVETASPGKRVTEGRLETVETYAPQPIELQLVNSQILAPFVLSASADNNATATIAAEKIGLRWQREGVTRLYVLIIALIPLVLGLLFFVVLFSGRLGHGGRTGPDLIAGIATVLLGILPIRLVLVPGEISSLTLLDYWLGLEMALLAALPCYAVWRALGRGRRQAAAPAAGSANEP